MFIPKGFYQHETGHREDYYLSRKVCTLQFQCIIIIVNSHSLQLVQDFIPKILLDYYFDHMDQMIMKNYCDYMSHIYLYSYNDLYFKNTQPYSDQNIIHHKYYIEVISYKSTCKIKRLRVH